jgi:hypothetical protein
VTIATVLGWIMVHALYVIAGAALLSALGVLRTDPRGLLWAIGPAYVAGLALVTLVFIVLLVIGIPLVLPTLIVVPLVLAGGLGYLGLRRRGTAIALPRALPFTSRGERALVLGLGALLVLYLLFAGTSMKDLPTNWDPAHMWYLRGSALYHFGGLNNDVFQNTALFAPFHMDYPLLQPAWQAAISHGIGQESVRWFHVEQWGLFAAALWTAAWLLAPGRRAVIWLPALLAIAVAGGTPNAPTQGNADLTVAIFVALGGLALGIWLERRNGAHLVLGALFLAAAANSKKEGQIFAAVLAVAVVVVLLAQRQWRPLRSFAYAIAGAVALIVPWLAFVSLNSLPSNDTVPLHTLLSNGYLTGRLFRLGIATDGVLGQLADVNNWVWAVPILAAVGLASLAARRLRPLAAYYLIASTLMVLALLWIYWTGSWPDVAIYLNVTVDRTTTSVALLAALAASHLAATAALPAPEAAADEAVQATDEPGARELEPARS